MQTRMQPIGTAWTKLSRVIRDLSEELGKKIELVQTGAETEIDRQLLEMIKDPLLHMVRNAADHGLEMPEERLALGKPAQGTINLRAAQEMRLHHLLKCSMTGAASMSSASRPRPSATA